MVGRAAKTLDPKRGDSISVLGEEAGFKVLAFREKREIKLRAMVSGARVKKAIVNVIAFTVKFSTPLRMTQWEKFCQPDRMQGAFVIEAIIEDLF